MTTIEKWPALRAARLVTAMLMWWLPMARSQQEVYPAWFNPLAGRQSGRVAFAVASGASQASAQITCKGRYCFPSAPSLELARNSRALRAPSILAGLLGRSSERDRLGTTVRT
jgi:hypothetical protein